MWVKNYHDNHYLDCEVNAFAAAMTLQVHALQPLPDAPSKAALTAKNEAADKPAFIQRTPQQSWFRRG
jgi:hypothetical protein